jgi:biopolymer transport protein ExbD
MLLSKSRRKRVINLTPLIDIVFLLLVFFMLASTFLKFGTVQLETAGGGTSGYIDTAKVALIHIGPDNSYYIAGAPVAVDVFGDALKQLRADGKTDAVVILRRQAKATDLVKGLTRVRQHGFNSVRVVD